MAITKHRVSTAAGKYLVNPLVKALHRFGLPFPGTCILETTGRKSGQPRRTPVGKGLDGDTFWIVAEHGERASYVKNIRANPRVRVKCGRHWRTGTATPMPDDDWRARQRQPYMARANAAVVRVMKTEPVTIRIDLDRSYDDRLEMTGREWMSHVYDELMDRESRWMGVRAVKNPLDIWVYQEILHEVRPQTIVELGSQFGGGALFFAHMLDLLGGDGKVITVDHFHGVFQADHPRITQVTGDTQAVADQVAGLCEGTTLVIHDAAHQEEKVLADLRAYAPLVTPGSYLIVEDGARDLLSGMTGPRAAAIRFLAETDDFEVDTAREKFLFTYNPDGFLRRR